MTRRKHLRWIAFGMGAGLAAALAACAARGPRPSPAGAPAHAPVNAPGSRAGRVAADLAVADAAFSRGDRTALAPALLGLARRGARPVDPGVPDPVAEWRATMPDLPALRGRALGPGYAHGTLAPGAATSIVQLFLSGQPATIAARSTPRVDMRMLVHDAAGMLVCDRSPAQADDCSFTPVYTQRYRIELSNGGPTRTRYYLVVD